MKIKMSMAEATFFEDTNSSSLCTRRKPIKYVYKIVNKKCFQRAYPKQL